MNHARCAMIALAVLVADQISKWLVLQGLDPYHPVEVTPFFNLALVWNRGVSFGMLNGLGDHGPWVLTALAAGIGAFLLIWLYREKRPVSRVALWLVLAGAATRSTGSVSVPWSISSTSTSAASTGRRSMSPTVPS